MKKTKTLNDFSVLELKQKLEKYLKDYTTEQNETFSDDQISSIARQIFLDLLKGKMRTEVFYFESYFQISFNDYAN